MTAVTVFNADGSYHRTTSLHGAISLLVREKAYPVEIVENAYVGPYPLVKAVALLVYVVERWLDGPAPCTKTNVRRAYKGVCAYCGEHGLTVDHILPESRGGRITWDNVVLACSACNGHKDNRTPDEAGMRLRYTPRTFTRREVTVRA